MARIDADVIKTSKPFKKFDLSLYISVFVIIVVLFLCYNSCGKQKNISAIEISVKGEIVYTYDFSSGKSAVYSSSVTEEKQGGLLLVTVKTEGGFNLIEIDAEERSARMRDADCSARRDCVHTKAIGRNGGAIVCVPHEVVVSASGGGVQPPVAG